MSLTALGWSWGQDINTALSKLPLTDLGNAERFWRRFGERFLYIDGRGWLMRRGTHWSDENADVELRKCAQSTIRAIAREAQAARDAGDTELADALQQHCQSSGSSGRISAMLREAEPYMTADADDLDIQAGPYKFNDRES